VAGQRPDLALRPVELGHGVVSGDRPARGKCRHLLTSSAGVSLADLRAGNGGTLVRLLEDVELDRDVLAHLEEHRLIPPCHLEVESVAPDGTFSIRVGEYAVGLSWSLANRLWILPTGALVTGGS
jgi:hypothetical protein